MKRTLKLFALLAALLLLVTAAASCGKKAPVFEEMSSERIAAHYGDQGLIVPGTQYVCRAYEKADFEVICDAFTSEEDLKKFKAFFKLVDYKDPTLDADGIAELRLTFEGVATDDNPVYVCDPYASPRELEVLDNFLAGVYGLEISATVPLPDNAPAA
ncbi:MAG: hypothetical protein GX628_03590 [Clostridiales bacterium]|mgnify:FL=1|nr:hypothetical protein [Clostridiales bacterium]